MNFIQCFSLAVLFPFICAAGNIANIGENVTVIVTNDGDKPSHTFVCGGANTQLSHYIRYPLVWKFKSGVTGDVTSLTDGFYLRSTDPRHTLKYAQNVNGGYDFSLTVRDIRASDEGEYICESVDGDIVVDRKSVFLRVSHPEETTTSSGHQDNGSSTDGVIPGIVTSTQGSPITTSSGQDDGGSTTAGATMSVETSTQGSTSPTASGKNNGGVSTDGATASIETSTQESTSPTASGQDDGGSTTDGATASIKTFEEPCVEGTPITITTTTTIVKTIVTASPPATRGSTSPVTTITSKRIEEPVCDGPSCTQTIITTTSSTATTTCTTATTTTPSSTENKREGIDNNKNVEVGDGNSSDDTNDEADIKPDKTSDSKDSDSKDGNKIKDTKNKSKLNHKHGHKNKH